MIQTSEESLKQVNVGICGLGTVGGGTLNVLQKNAQSIEARASAVVNVSHVGSRSEKPDLNTDGMILSRDIFDVIRDPSVNIVVELIGGTTIARDLVLEAISHGKHVVTANKALIAEHGNEIFSAASEKGVAVAYEAAVAGGIPIIRALREGLSANEIKWVAGIINGTGNFILTEMRDKGRDFADVLKEAQDLGYAEADPTFDIEGIDAAHKLAILASIAFGIPLDFDRVFTEGLSKLEPIDVTNAGELGYAIKHLGIARNGEKGVEMRVHPTLVPKSQLIASVDGVMNAVMIEGDAVGPTLYCGAGAGSGPTASSVVADIVEIARQIDLTPEQRTPYLGFNQQSIQSRRVLPIKECETALYLRFNAVDKSGVLSQVAEVFKKANINVEAMVQKDVPDQHTEVPIVLLTDRALQSELSAVVADLEELDVVSGSVTSIRVEALAN